MGLRGFAKGETPGIEEGAHLSGGHQGIEFAEDLPVPLAFVAAVIEQGDQHEHYVEREAFGVERRKVR